jgi:hypothetical protein
MALNADIHWGLILRVDVSQLIEQEGWKHLLTHALHPYNFDGEIFGMHSTMDSQLRKFGFRGEEAGQEADFVDVDRGYHSASKTVNWLERVPVSPLIDGLKPFEAWKLKNSGVYDVITFDDRIVTKGTHVDWPPLIGKIY